MSAQIFGSVPLSDKGAPHGVAPLDENGVVPAGYIPVVVPEPFTPVGLYPTTYQGGPIVKDNRFIIIADGTVGAVSVQNGDTLIALVDAPGQTDANWTVANGTIGGATESFAGIAETLTQPETNAGLDDSRILTIYKWLQSTWWALVTGHIASTSNPHGTTAAQVGAPPTSRTITAGSGLQGGGDLSSDRTLSIIPLGVTNAMLAAMAQFRLKGSVAIGTQAPQDLTGTEVTAFLDEATTGLKGMLSPTDKVKLNNTTGLNSGDQTITLTGDVTGSGTGSFAATIPNDTVTNVKAANMATQTVKGRITAGTGDPEDLTTAELTTLINVATSLLKGAMSAADKVRIDTYLSVPTVANKDMAASVTTASGQELCSTAMAASPAGQSYVAVHINGIRYTVGNGVKTKAVYFSGDGGTTARALTAIVANDKVYRGDTLGFDTAVTDSVDFDYNLAV